MAEDRNLSFECPKCKERIYVGVNHAEPIIICDSCKAEIDIPESIKIQINMFKTLSDSTAKITGID